MEGCSLVAQSRLILVIHCKMIGYFAASKAFSISLVTPSGVQMISIEEKVSLSCSDLAAIGAQAFKVKF